MAKSRELKLELPSIDDLFSTQEMRDEKDLEKIKNIDIDLIDPFPEHPFQVREDEDMEKMVESIKQYGVLSPVILRPKEDGRYEMIAGHRRKFGSEKADQETIPAIVRDMSDDESIVLMVDSNLQREKILPSEKAFAYKMKLEAVNRQGKRTDLTCSPLGNKLEKGRTSHILASEVSESKTQIFRYVRLTELIPELLDLVDDGSIALRPAVELSYIPVFFQRELYETIKAEDCTPSYAQTVKMRKLLAEDKLTPEVLWSIMQEEKPNQKERLVLRDDRIRKLIPQSLPKAKTEEYVIQALEHYGRYRARNEQER